MKDFTTDVLIEAAKHQLLPMFDEITLPALHAFGVTPLTSFIIMAILGAFVIALALYGLGVLLSLRMRGKQPEKYQIMRDKLKNTLMLALLVISSPFGFMLAFCAGYFRTPLTYSIPLMLIGLGAYYGLAYG